MEKAIAVKNFVTFAIPLSMLLVCKVILPTSMYESIVNYTADKIFMPPPDNRGMCTMYEKSITPRTFLMWSTSNLQAVKSTFSSMLLELGCTAHVGSSIDEEIEFIEYTTLAPKRLSQFTIGGYPLSNPQVTSSDARCTRFTIPEEEQTTMVAVDYQQPKVALEETKEIENSPKPIVINIGSTS